MKARLVIQTGTDRPEVRKSALVTTLRHQEANSQNKSKVKSQKQVIDWGERQSTESLTQRFADAFAEER